jgi:hypothetical protein
MRELERIPQRSVSPLGRREVSAPGQKVEVAPHAVRLRRVYPRYATR